MKANSEGRSPNNNALRANNYGNQAKKDFSTSMRIKQEIVNPSN